MKRAECGAGETGKPAQTIGQNERIHRRREFQKVYETGQRIHGRFMTAFLLPNGVRRSRLGVAVGRRIGGAVRRNRAKRLAREIFRRNKVAGGFDIVIAPRPGFLDTSFANLEGDYLGILRRRPRV